MNLPVFPLPLVLFPGGVTRLRIFEQRYLRMVRESAGDKGFVLSTHMPNLVHQSSRLGSWVKVIDFETLDDGMLGIDIEAQHSVVLSDFEIEPDRLCRAQATMIGHWDTCAHNETTLVLADKYQRLMTDCVELKSLYPEPKLDDAAWVCARWLEVLPIAAEQKLVFFQPDSFTKATNLLDKICN